MQGLYDAGRDAGADRADARDRNNPKYSVMFIDDIGVDLAKSEGLIEQLPPDQIPNMERC